MSASRSLFTHDLYDDVMHVYSLAHPCTHRGLAFKIILFFLDKVASTTSESNVASLRFRNVTDGIAPAVVTNARCPNGFLKIPAALKPLVQGLSTTVR